MAGRRRRLERADVTDLFAVTEPKRRNTPYDAKYARWTVRVKPMTRDKIKAIAKREGIGLFDLVRWVLRQFVYDYEQEDIVLPVEEYVVTKSRLAD
jgi:hypothetical protein